LRGSGASCCFSRTPGGGGGGGPAVELLEYITPRDGRPYPHDSRANDLWHWQITLQVIDAAATCRVLRAAGTRFISPGGPPSPGVVELNDNPAGAIAGSMVRDPDGHALRIVQYGQRR
jgi:hypothetical protein